MPLPPENTPWLPKPWDFTQEQYRINNAWYIGDLDELQRIYSGATPQATHLRDGVPHEGGVRGAMARFFHGRPVPPNQTRTRLHVPAPQDLAVLSSDLLYAEPPEVRIPGEDQNDQRAQDRLDLIFNSPNAHGTFSTMGEYKSAFGAAALITKWNTELADHPWVTTAAADVIIPEFTDGFLTALTLWSEFRDGANAHLVWRHLERHEKGVIFHGLYQGTNTNLGKLVPLQDRPETAPLATLVNADGAIPTGIPYLTASYPINLPSRAWRRKGVLANAGRSDYQGILPLFDALDEAWSSWIRDLRLARARLVVPEAWLDITGPGSAASFDVDREIFSTVSALVKPGESGMELVQPEIRVEAHEATVYALYKEILRAAGFSASSWGDYTTKRDVTATEVQDRDKASERTRDKKTLYDRMAIGRQARAALALDGVLFPGKGGKDIGADAAVTFPPGSQIDPFKNSQTIANLRAAQLLTIETGVRMAHPDWDDPRVTQEVEGLAGEAAARSAALTLSDPTVNPADQAAA